ncbi:hypothetical protein [Streptomyces phaeochromogenes]|uniref:hypothetical protein n=1 Tax=Streptomyces phaeochromogenes TaxID=1923 RepID=UPI00340FED42
MRLHTTAVLSALAVLALTGCSTDRADSIVKSSTTVSVRPGGESAPASTPLSSAALAQRLLDESDLGEGYTRTPQRSAQHDDVTVIGCPALEKLGSEVAVGGSLDFPHKAKASFTYAVGSGSEVSEELYSDTTAKLSRGVSRIFDAMTSCPTYQVLVGSTSVDMGTEQMTAPPVGDEQWSQRLTYSVGRQRSVVQQTAIRVANVLVIVSGSPGLVDAHLAKAVDKVQRTR